MSIAKITSITATLTLASCAMPPREALQRIQKDGLIAFLTSDDVPAKPQATPSRPTPPPTSITTPASQTPASNPNLIGPPVIATQNTTAPTPPSVSLSQNTVSEKTLTAMAVPSLPGFVRSPYTNPPRLVDVKGAQPGATMICPYTQRAFIIPRDYTAPATPATSIASNTTPAPKIENNAPVPSLKNDTLLPKTATSTAPMTAANNPPKTQPQPKSTAPTTPAPANKTPAPTTKPVVTEIPFGLPIPGRPGFVNSPYAQKHQLVDVTGLPTGMEVKCPYTGKLFRVPAQDIAQQKNLAAPNPATPEKK